jgi:hypothetical protein
MSHDVERLVDLVRGERRKLVDERLDVVRGSMLAGAESLEVRCEDGPVSRKLWQEVTPDRRGLGKPMKQENWGRTPLSGWFGAMKRESDTVDCDLVPLGPRQQISAHR